jgi:aminoglycoside 2'-N-acetyltransferase I
VHEIRVLRDDELLVPLRQLLDDAFGDGFDDTDWHHTFGGWRVVAVEGGEPVAHAAVVPRDIRIGEVDLRAGYVEGVATAPARQGDGLGAAVMEVVTLVLHDHFELGVLSTGLDGFYERFGWRRWAGPTFVRDGTHVRRTEDEDDGIMVLPFGPSAEVEATAPITCAARAGDDW